MTKRDEFTKQVAGLADRIEKWTVPHGWATQLYSKKMRDPNHESYEATALFLQRGPTHCFSIRWHMTCLERRRSSTWH